MGSVLVLSLFVMLKVPAYITPSSMMKDMAMWRMVKVRMSVMVEKKRMVAISVKTVVRKRVRPTEKGQKRFLNCEG